MISMEQNIKYLELNRIADIGTGSSDRKDAIVDGSYPLYVRSKEILRSNKFEFDEEAIIIPGEGGIGEIFHYVNGKYALHQRAYRIHITDNRVLTKFLFYYFMTFFKSFINKKALSGTVTSIRKPMLEKFSIPIIPVEEQLKLISVFEKFDKIIFALEEELSLREKQLNYYRDLFISKLEQYNVCKLSEVSDVYDGTHQTPKYTSCGIPFISVENISDIYSSNKFISEDDFEKYKIKPELNDVFMTRIGTIGKCAIMEKEEKLAYYVSLALIRPNLNKINPRYLKYYIESTEGKKQLAKRTLQHAVPIKINKEDVGKIELKVPSLEIQEELACKLDSFYKLIYDNKSGLQTEIALRKEQYDYSRKKLLNFRGEY